MILESDLRPGQHLAVLGADAHGKQEVELEAIERCRLFCDEWEQASAGGELANAVDAGLVKREDVTQLGDVITGAAEGRRTRRRDHALRLDRPGDPGPGDLPGRL